MIAMDDVCWIVAIISFFLICVVVLIVTTILKNVPEAENAKQHQLNRDDIINSLWTISIIIVIVIAGIACICAAYMLLKSACV